MSVDVRNLRRVVTVSGAVATTVQAVTAVVAMRRGRRDYADGVWGPGLAAIAFASAALGNGDAKRRWMLAATTAGWAIRLELLMMDRLRGTDEEDARYTEFLDGDSTLTVLAKVFVTQGIAQVLVSSPIQVAAASPLPRTARRWLFPVGMATMIAGAVVEATADRQKVRFTERDRDECPEVLDTGLWGRSRHPNYFGDSLVWDGVWIASAASAPAGWTAAAPALMNYLLIYATGAKRTERNLQEQAAYRDYQKRVSFFLPLPARNT